MRYRGSSGTTILNEHTHKLDLLDMKFTSMSMIISNMDGRVARLETRFDGLETDVKSVKGDVQRILALLEDKK